MCFSKCPWAWFSHDCWVPGPLAVKPQSTEAHGHPEECHTEEEAGGMPRNQTSAWCPLCSSLCGHSPSLCLPHHLCKQKGIIWPSDNSQECPKSEGVKEILLGLYLELSGVCACINPRKLSYHVMPIKPHIYSYLTVKMFTLHT